MRISYTLQDKDGNAGFNIYLNEDEQASYDHPTLCKWISYVDGQLTVQLGKSLTGENVAGFSKSHNGDKVTRFAGFDVDFDMTIYSVEMNPSAVRYFQDTTILDFVLGENFWANPKPHKEKVEYDVKADLTRINNYLAGCDDIVPQISDGQITLYRRIVKMEAI